MKLIHTRLLLLCWLALAVNTGKSRAETPTQAVDRIWNAWITAQKDNKQNDYTALSLKIAREQGTAVIAPIMVRSKDWKSEEGMIFSVLVDFLPRKKAIAVLQHYQKEGKPWEQQAAADFLAEFDMSDVKEMVRKYTTTPSETPAAALDQITHVWRYQIAIGVSPENLILQKDFIHLSRKIALEQGCDLVPALLTQRGEWQGKDPMPFTVLLWFLPWEETASALDDYKGKGNTSEQQAAIELLAEINKPWPKALIDMPEAERNKLMEESAP